EWRNRTQSECTTRSLHARLRRLVEMSGTSARETESLSEDGSARVSGSFGQLLLDPQQLVVLGHAIDAGRCARLDLASVRRYCKVRDERVCSLTRSVRNHRLEPCAMRHLDCFKGFGE